MKALPMIALIALGVAGWQLSRQPATQLSAKPNGKAVSQNDWTLDLGRTTDKWGREFSRDIAKAVSKEIAPHLAQLSREAERRATDFKSDLPGFQAPHKTALSSVQLSQYEKTLCDLANRERKQSGLKPLQISPALAEVARAHSREMAQLGYFDHNSPTPENRTVMDRYRSKFKSTPRLVAENIYKLQSPNSLQAADFRRAHSGWMNSPGHRANILRSQPNGGPTQIGVGIVMIGNAFWATQNFARP